MSWWRKKQTAVIANVRTIEYPVKLETEVIGYVNGDFSTKTSGGLMKSSDRGIRQTNFRISSDGEVLEGFVDDAQRKVYLPSLNIQHLDLTSKTEFTNKTGLTLKVDTELTQLLTALTLRVNGKFGLRDDALYVTPAKADTSLTVGKQSAINESTRIRTAILAAAQTAAVAAAAAAAPPAPPAAAAADLNAVALAREYGAAMIDTYDTLIAALRTVNTLAIGGQAPGKDLAQHEIDEILPIIDGRYNAAGAGAGAGTDQAAFAASYGANPIDTFDRLTAALLSVNTLATGAAAAAGQALAAAEIIAIVDIIDQRRTNAADAAAAPAAAGVAPAAAAADPDAAALAGVYAASGAISADNLIVLTAVNALATGGGGAGQALAATSIGVITAAATAKIPLLDNADKIIAFIKSVPITERICGHSHAKFDDKTVALLFMVYAGRLDVHFIKKRSTVPYRKTTVIGDTHYISRSIKDILTIKYNEIDVDNKTTMLKILSLICLPVSFKIANIPDDYPTNTAITYTYGFRNRHTAAATLPYENVGTLRYPFTADNGEINLILGRATNRQEAVVASAQFNNAPAIAKLTDLKGLLCDKDPEILTAPSCTAIQTRIGNLESGQAGGRRSRKRMNKNKRASSRHSRRQRHGHNSRKRYSAGSKSKSGTKSKSASKRRRKTGGT